MGWHLLRAPERKMVKSTVPLPSYCKYSRGGREVFEVGVEAVLSRREVDRRVLTADSANGFGLRTKRRPPCGVAQGFIPIPVFSSEVCVGCGVEQNDQNGLGEESCDSSDVPRNMVRTGAF